MVLLVNNRSRGFAGQAESAWPCETAVVAVLIFAAFISMRAWFCADLLHRNCPCMASMAESAASKLSYETKPKPRERPVSGSRIIFGVATIIPKAEKVSYSSCGTSTGP